MAMWRKTEIVVALIGLAGVFAAALISNWNSIFISEDEIPTAVIGELREMTGIVSGDKKILFQGLEYVARPAITGGYFTVDVIYRGSRVASHEFGRDSKLVVLTVGNCNYIRLGQTGNSTRVGRVFGDLETISQIQAEINIQTNCAF